MKVANVDAAALTWADTDPPGYLTGFAHLTEPLGASRIAGNLYELAPGQVSNRRLPEVIVYPDSNKVAAFTGSDDDSIRAWRDQKLAYYDGEVA